MGGRLLYELAILVPLYQAYRLVRSVTNDQFDEALANARDVLRFERALNLDIEHGVQRLVLDHSELVWFLNRYYVYVHFSGTVAVLVWLYVRHLRVYESVRRVLIMTTLVALVLHVAYPLNPPRLMPGRGFIDTITEFGPSIYEDDRISRMANQIAAMPSLHFGWAVIVAWGVIRALRSRWRWCAIAHPVITLIAIVATANHWWIDAAVAGVIVAAAIGAETTARLRHPSPLLVPPYEPAPATEQVAGAQEGGPPTAT